MFGMGTGDPSQYGHRQAWQAFCEMVISRAAIPLCFFSKDLRSAFNLWMALGGMVVPQLAATSACPGLFLPGLTGMRFANWRQQNQNEIDWIYKAC